MKKKKKTDYNEVKRNPYICEICESIVTAHETCSGLESMFLHLSLIRHSRELVRKYLMIPLKNADPLKLKLLVEKRLV